MNKKNIQYNKGAAMMILVFFFVFISFTILIGIVAPSVREFRIVSDIFDSKKTYFAAESSIEDLFYRVNSGDTFDGNETLVLGDSTVTTTVSSVDSDHKTITTIADTGSHQRKIVMNLAKGSGVAFNYGVQVGAGGLSLDSGMVVGNVFVGGNVTASSSGSNGISGSVTAFNSDPLTEHVSNGVSGTPSSSISFGQANATQDFAQSFRVDDDMALNKVQVYIKRVGSGSPSNVTVSINSDSSGSVGSVVYTSSTALTSTLVGSSYGWVDFYFPNNSVLQMGTTYWLVLNGATSSTNYYTIAANTNGYVNGVAKIGRNSSWSFPSPSTLDGYFKVFLGGIPSTISGADQYNRLNVGSNGTGDVKASVVNYVNTPGTIYCTTGTQNNKSCNTTFSNPSVAWPISDSNIQSWKDEAAAGTIYNGNQVTTWNGANTYGVGKIVGSLDVISGWTATVNGTLWITGNLNVSGGSLLRLASSYGANSGVIIVDGTVSISSGGNMAGSGTNGSYITIVSLSPNLNNAISLQGGSGAVVLVAQNGGINVSSGASAKEVTGYRVSVTGGSTITYESGLASLSFSSGPSGSWNVSKWQETQ